MQPEHDQDLQHLRVEAVPVLLLILIMPTLIKKYKLKIYNQKTDKKIPKDAWYVGRPSTFGNPFEITKKVTREKSLKLYREYMTKNLKIAELAKRHLKGKDLVCWCSPESCHAEILMEAAND